MILRDTKYGIHKRVKFSHCLSEFWFQLCTSVVVASPSNKVSSMFVFLKVFGVENKKQKTIEEKTSVAVDV